MLRIWEVDGLKLVNERYVPTTILLRISPQQGSLDSGSFRKDPPQFDLQRTARRFLFLINLAMFSGKLRFRLIIYYKPQCLNPVQLSVPFHPFINEPKTRRVVVARKYFGRTAHSGPHFLPKRVSPYLRRKIHHHCGSR